MIKDGKQHTKSIRDGRRIFINGSAVDDVTTHPAFRNVVKSAGQLYDHVSDPENRDLMTTEVAGSADRINRIWELPESYSELVERRRALESWAGLSAGFLGRSPDHVASCISGMYMGLEVFEAHDKDRAGALREYYKYARDNDLYLSYVIINPQANRSKPPHEQDSEFLTAGVVDEDSEGITVRGAKMLATAGVLSNEVFVSCIQPLKPGDERYAISFAIPINAPGITLLSRKSYEQQATNTFDNPLANQFDENDSIIYFDDVKVPWDRVFVNQNLEMSMKQWHATPCHVYQNYQAQVRLMVKMRFMLGLARRLADTNGITGIPQVRDILGNLAAQGAMVDAFVNAMEAKGTFYGKYFVPDRHMLYAAQNLTQNLYPQVASTIRELTGGAMIALPSSVKDFGNPDIKRLIEKTQQSPASDADGRVKFLKLAWDAIGSEFGSRHTQYEMFYAGAPFVIRGHSFRNYDWDKSLALVDQVLDAYTLESELENMTDR